MAVTKLKVRRANGKQSVAAFLQDRCDYALNPDKTGGGKYTCAYQCAQATAAKEFLVSKQIYEAVTGRSRPREADVVSYGIIQSFLPGEITPEQANELGRKIALEFTGGQHQFIVGTHVDRGHVHNHIEINSTTLDCSRKFNNYKDTVAALREISDKLCREYGLSVIEEPADQGKHYAEWDAEKKGRSWKALLKETIDAALPGAASFEEFLAAMCTAGYEVAEDGKFLKFRAADQERYTRAKTLGADYTEETLRSRVGKSRGQLPRRKKSILQPKPDRVNLLIDIQARLAQGKGAGYARWATIHNLKEASRTLNFLTEHGITEYGTLAQKTAETTAAFDAASTKIKALESRMAQIAALKTHIINYAKTREVYMAYRKSRFKEKFRAAHEGELLLHEAAKRAFDAQGVRKLPTVKALNEEYAGLLADKKSTYADFTRLRKEAQELQAVKANVDSLLHLSPPEPEKDQTRGQGR